MAFWIIPLAVVLFVLAIVLEGQRQARKLREQGEEPASGRGGNTGSSLIGLGGLELQKMFQPDRSVEAAQIMLQDAEEAEQLAAPDDEVATSE